MVTCAAFITVGFPGDGGLATRDKKGSQEKAKTAAAEGSEAHPLTTAQEQKTNLSTSSYEVHTLAVIISRPSVCLTPPIVFNPNCKIFCSHIWDKEAYNL